MRKITAFNNISIDGFYSGPNGEIDWFVPDTEVFKFSSKGSSADTMLFGRITYQIFEKVWPNVAKDPNAPEAMKAMADSINKSNKIVFSNTLNEVTWENSELVKEDPASYIKKLKQEEGGDMLIFGAGSIVRALTKESLIDQYTFVLNPIIAGNGKTLFEGLDRIKLKLIDSTSFKSGNVLLNYTLDK